MPGPGAAAGAAGAAAAGGAGAAASAFGGMDFISMGLSAAGGIYNIVSGIVDKAKGRKMARRNIRPVLGDLVTNDYEDLLGLYEQQAQYGIDPSALQFAAGKSESGLSGTLQSMLLAGANPNSVGQAYSSFTDAMGNLATSESEKRWQKISALAPITEQLANAKLQTFLYDKDAVYKDTAKLAAELQNKGKEQTASGIDSLFGNLLKQRNADKSYDQMNKILEAYLNRRPDGGQPQGVNNNPAGLSQSFIAGAFAPSPDLGLGPAENKNPGPRPNTGGIDLMALLEMLGGAFKQKE